MVKNNCKIVYVVQPFRTTSDTSYVVFDVIRSAAGCPGCGELKKALKA